MFIDIPCQICNRKILSIWLVRGYGVSDVEIGATCLNCKKLEQIKKCPQEQVFTTKRPDEVDKKFNQLIKDTWL